MKKLWLLAGVLAVVGCGSPGEVTQEGTMPADSSATSASTPMDLAQVDLPLLWTPPEAQLLNGATPQVQWKEETGRVEITAGDHFGLAITEEPADLARLKADLDRDQLVRNTIVREDTAVVVYRSEFPDDPTLVFVHFYQVLHVGGRTFVVQDLDGPRYNEQDIARMVASLSVKQPA